MIDQRGGRREALPLIINLAPTGAVADNGNNPYLPMSVTEIAADVKSCARLGGSIMHLHVRSDDGAPSSDPKLFANLISTIREDEETRPLILCATTSGRHGQTPEQRAAVLELPKDIRPDMASLTLGSLNFMTGPSINSHDDIRYLADRMNENDVKPELEIFDAGMIEYARTLIDEGRLKPPHYFNLLLGNVGGLQANVVHLGFALSNLPEDSIVSVAGIGRYQKIANGLGVLCANGVRVGLEDNLWLDNSTKSPARNVDLVSRVVEMTGIHGRSIARVEEVRKWLGFQSF